VSAPFRIVVKNEAAVASAFRQVRKDTLKMMRPALRRAAEPVRAQAAALFSRYDPHSAAGYKVRVRARGVAVEQSLKRTTGLHPSFGSLQMRQALLPALEDKGEAVKAEIVSMVDLAGIKAGL
jgi:hypothetical protein